MSILKYAFIFCFLLPTYSQAQSRQSEAERLYSIIAPSASCSQLEAFLSEYSDVRSVLIRSIIPEKRDEICRNEKEAYPFADFAPVSSIISYRQNKCLTPESVPGVKFLNRCIDVTLKKLGVNELSDGTIRGTFEIISAKNSLDDLTPISALYNLEDFTVTDLGAGSKGIINIQPVDELSLLPLSELARLRNFSSHNSQILSLRGLEDKPRLTRLDVSGSRIKDLNPIIESPLVYLNITGTQISNDQIFSKLNEIEVLLAGGTNIEELNSNKFNNSSIRVLSVSGINTINFDGAILDELEIFIANNSNLIKMSSLSKSKNLKYLEVRFSDFDDLHFLPNLNSLQFIYLTKSSISDLDFLPKSAPLKVVDLGGTNISDIDIMSNFNELNKIGLHKTTVKDFSSLKNLEFLSEIILPDGTKIGGSCSTKLSIEGDDKYESICAPFFSDESLDMRIHNSESGREAVRQWQLTLP